MRIAVLVAALLIPLLLVADGFGTTAQSARRSCGTITSTSTYDRARVIAIRGVTCRRARRVARAYDHRGEQVGRWRCALAHDDRPRLFSCGWPATGGDLRDARHAITARGVND